MSRTFSLGCTVCNVQLWIGQASCNSEHLYAGGEYDAKLSNFMFAHQAPKCALIFADDNTGLFDEMEDADTESAKDGTQEDGEGWSAAPSIPAEPLKIVGVFVKGADGVTEMTGMQIVNPHQSKIYRLRAEREQDVVSLIYNLPPGELVRSEFLKQTPLPDVVAEIEVNTFTLEQLRSVCRKVEDGQVMAQTVQPKDRYTGDRDFSV